MEILTTGRLHLYSVFSTNYQHIPAYMQTYQPNRLPGPQVMVSEKTDYYFSEGDSDIVQKIKAKNIYSKRFEKEMKPYFESCPRLTEEMERKLHLRGDVESVFRQFNRFCGN